MRCYASATGTRRNLAAMMLHGWGLCVSSVRTDLWRPGWRYFLDNGAWTAHQQGTPFDEAAFVEAVERLGAGADFVVAPDIVGGGHASLQLSAGWLDWMLQRCRRVVIAVQDGVEPWDVAHLRHERVGVAIGGSTDWKVEQLGRRRWAGRGWVHALRVNTNRRIWLAAIAGCDSFDGSSPTRFAVNTPRLTRAARQEAIPWAS